MSKEPQPKAKNPPAKLDDIRDAAKIVSIVLLELKELTVPGAQLDLLDEYANKRIKELGAQPVLLGYHPTWAKDPFPATMCASVDYEVAHGIPGRRELREGMIIKYDLAVRYKTGCGDAALTVAVGQVDNFKQRLMRYGQEALMEGVKAIKAGVPVSAIGKAIEHYCLLKNMEIIKDFAGHHIGEEIHMTPNVSSFHVKEEDEVLLEEGKVICIEPFITRIGYGRIGIADDGWTAYQLRGQPVVQFEHMVLITKEGFEILTNHI